MRAADAACGSACPWPCPAARARAPPTIWRPRRDQNYPPPPRCFPGPRGAPAHAFLSLPPLWAQGSTPSPSAALAPAHALRRLLRPMCQRPCASAHVLPPASHATQASTRLRTPSGIPFMRMGAPAARSPYPLAHCFPTGTQALVEATAWLLPEGPAPPPRTPLPAAGGHPASSAPRAPAVYTAAARRTRLPPIYLSYCVSAAGRAAARATVPPGLPPALFRTSWHTPAPEEQARMGGATRPIPLVPHRSKRAPTPND